MLYSWLHSLHLGLPLAVHICCPCAPDPACQPQGVLVYLSSQCTVGHLDPHLYKSGSAALKLGVESGHSQMTPEAAVVKASWR